MKIPEANMAMSHHMAIIEDKDEGGYVLYYPDLPGCITCGQTLESTLKNAVDAKREWLRCYNDDIHSQQSLTHSYFAL